MLTRSEAIEVHARLHEISLAESEKRLSGIEADIDMAIRRVLNQCCVALYNGPNIPYELEDCKTYLIERVKNIGPCLEAPEWSHGMFPFREREADHGASHIMRGQESALAGMGVPTDEEIEDMIHDR